MSVSIDHRLWLAAHLLYPNSSQAFDVYQAILTQSENAIKSQNSKIIIQKLYKIVSKVPPVKSNQPFHALESLPIDHWIAIYKKSPKNQLIILIGVLVLQIPLAELAPILKMTNEKVIFLFQQVFKKTVTFTARPEVSQSIKLKKKGDHQVSFLFTYENLLDYSLNNLSEKDRSKVQAGLQRFPELQFVEKKYQLIIQQIQNLLGSEIEKPADVTSLLVVQASRPMIDIGAFLQNVNQYKNRLALMVGTVVLLVVAIIRPDWVRQFSLKESSRFVTLQEVEKKWKQDGSSTDSEKMSLNEIAIQSNSDEKVKAKSELSAPVIADNKNAAVAANSIEKDKVASKNPPLPALPSEKAQTSSTTSKTASDSTIPASGAQIKKQGGLYRGVLIVTDLNEVNSKIKDKVVEIGGKKAGEVELGWIKSQGLAYYHFTVPENNVDTVKSFLSQFGSLQIQFENHPRLLPPGIKRMIIEVKERE